MEDTIYKLPLGARRFGIPIHSMEFRFLYLQFGLR
jgi:hypothetical protein